MHRDAVGTARHIFVDRIINMFLYDKGQMLTLISFYYDIYIYIYISETSNSRQKQKASLGFDAVSLDPKLSHVSFEIDGNNNHMEKTW
jgi:hypothetical protein